MKQVLQSLKTGATEVANVPAPAARRGQVLVRTRRSLVSVGTERMLVEFGKAGWLEKARLQPEKVRMVLDKIRTDGLAPTFGAVMNKLDQPLPLGYCNVGVALEAGAATGFVRGDRVVSNGHHAEVVSVAKNLCARVPDGVSDEEAAFTVIGAIALQGIRLAEPTLGESVVVTGMGLIGLIAVQLLRSQGCRVMAIDFDQQRLEMARRFGATVVNPGSEDPVAAAQSFSRGRGVDAVLITAATKSNEPMHQAAQMSRKRGRIVLVGVAGLELSRADFFEKELTFQVSCSYGPGRYDPVYEERGIDYPVGFVRWTEQRNFEAVLDMMADRRLDVRPLVSHRIPIADALRAYELVSGGESALGIVLEYPEESVLSEADLRSDSVELSAVNTTSAGTSIPSISFIGSGNYATAVLIPAFKATDARLRTIVSRGGVTGVHAGRKFGFESTTTESDRVFSDSGTDAVVIATRHDTHAGFVVRALESGKHVFVEKPLALSVTELDQIAAAYATASANDRRPILMVGFNRRFSPHARQARVLLEGVREPMAMVMTVNAGAIPPEHWTQDPLVGGGRIIGEACHFIDLMRYLTGSPITSFEAVSIGKAAGVSTTDDKATIILRFADGSIGTIVYLANGHKSFPKERLEVFAGGRILQFDNFRKLEGYGWTSFSKSKLWKQDKGQVACAAAFVSAVRTGGPAPIPFDEVLEVSRVAVVVAEALR